MAVYNPITGLKRRMPRCLTPWKKRKTTSSTIAARTIVEDAMDAYFTYVLGHKKCLLFVLMLSVIGVDFQSANGRFLCIFFLRATALYASKAAVMLCLDSELMDLHKEDLENCGYNKELVDITLDTYSNNDECENNTRFSKLELMTMMHYLGFGDGNGYI